MELAIERIAKQNAIAAGWLLWIEERRAETKEQEADIIGRSAGPDMSGIRGSMPGKTTENRGQEVITKTAYEKAWIQLIDDVSDQLPIHLKVFLKLRQDYRFSRGRNGWMCQVQQKFAQEMADLTGLSTEHTYRSPTRLADYWDEIVEITAREAIARQLFKPRSRDIPVYG